MATAPAPASAEPKSGKRAAESDNIAHTAGSNGLPPDVKRIALTAPSPRLSSLPFTISSSAITSSSTPLAATPAPIASSSAARPVIVASLAPPPAPPPVAAPAAAVPSYRHSSAHALAPIQTLRFLEVEKDDTGAVVLTPEFLVSGAPDDLPCMPLAAVPSAHRHAAIALAVREGRLSDAQKKELYEIWRQANPGGG